MKTCFRFMKICLDFMKIRSDFMKIRSGFIKTTFGFMMLFVFILPRAVHAEIYMDGLSIMDCSARSVGIGNIQSIQNTGFESIFSNPGALTDKGNQIGLMQKALPCDIRYQVAGMYFQNVMGFNVGIGLKNLSTGAYYITALDNQDNAYIEGNASYSQNQTRLMINRNLFGQLNAGVGFSYEMIQSGDNSSARGYGVDIGSEWMILEWLTLSGMIQNFMGRMTWDTGAQERIRANYILGAAVNLQTFRVLLEMDNVTNFHRTFQMGVIMNWERMAEFRLGYHMKNSATSEDEWAGAGFGINLDSFTLDYAYRLHFQFSERNEHSFSLRLIL